MAMTDKQYKVAMLKWAVGKATRKQIMDCLDYQRTRKAMAENAALCAHCPMRHRDAP